MKIKPATITDEEGNVIKEIPMTLADDDWIRAGRLGPAIKRQPKS